MFLWLMAVNTFLNFFLTLLMSSPFQYLLPQCSLVAVKIRLSTCPGRELESDLSRTTCINSPGSSHCPTGVPRWFLWGALRMFWYADCTFVVTGKGNCQIWGCTVRITVLQKWLRSNEERPFCVCHGGWGLEEMLALWGAATFLSNTNGEALGASLMCSNYLHVTLLTCNLGTSEVLDFP